jgi:antagonist of KipI
MMLVKSPGLFTTVQDLGRESFGPMGVSPSGAADSLALRVGNRLVGNSEGAAALEMTLTGGEFEFDQDTVVALTGSDFGAGLELWRAHLIEAGQILRFGPTRTGARCYMCVRGGIDVPLFLGSASTHVLSGLGGFEGRPLRKGDRLRIGPSVPGFRERHSPIFEYRKTIQVTKGPQWDWFTPASRDSFFGTVYRLTEECNRMGLRLEGSPLETRRGNMISEGVPLGAIQVPASGQPIILFVEQQTTGGYPKIANVISADLPSVGQLRPRDEIRFALVTPAAALALLREQEQRLAIDL